MFRVKHLPVLVILQSVMLISCGSGEVRSDNTGGGPPDSVRVTCPSGPGGGSSSVGARWCRSDGMWHECERNGEWRNTHEKCR
jgi:hypothetical protein